MWQGQRVSVVLPAYNEEDSIRSAVESFFVSDVVDEVVVVDNNSTDSTAAEAAATRARLVTETTQGYGAALRRGLREATGDLIILAEPDATFMGKDVLKLLAYADDFDLVCGTRTTRELIWAEANMGWFLRVGNVIVAKMLQVLFNTCSLSDCGCTLRLVKRERLIRFRDKLTVRGSHFLPEMVILAHQHGLSIIEIPVNYRGRSGTSKITGTLKGTLKTGTNMIKLIVGYRLSHASARRPQ
ncbi:MAG TPA: glycosyltransferase family 2 protein [Vicinamibacterales bacterium]|nr:glycosyltransferase family 2 protein [Vicinamibacterales bacterium]